MRWIALPLICVAAAGIAVTAATARTETRGLIVATTGPTAPLATGLADPLFTGPQAMAAFAVARQAGATYARLMVYWSSIAPQPLPVSGFDPTDPTSPGYRWNSLDASVAAAHAAGITPILDIVSPPSWAYEYKPVAWTGGSPKIDALGAFATALATHFDGSGTAPAEHVFSVWNEPNYSKNLYPQDPTLYRSMVNAVADSVHAVDAANLVVAGELAPFKGAADKTDRNRAIPPLAFMREMFCLSDGKNPQRLCDAQTEFDVWAHHPYATTGPWGHAKSKDGVTLGDLPKMEALLQTAWQLGAISSAKPPQFWVTEFGWSSNPPNKKGAPVLLEARWVAESMYQMWSSGVTLGTWFLLDDRPLNTPFQSGLYFRSSSVGAAQAKPLLTPFSFPFVAYLRRHGKVDIWGRDTTNDTQDVTIQERIRSRGLWRNVAIVTSNRYGIFQATLPLKATSSYWVRASAPGSGTSWGFSLHVPRNENRTVTPFPVN
jgi:hypothetical protein